jgi:hypothetical protein
MHEVRCETFATTGCGNCRIAIYQILRNVRGMILGITGHRPGIIMPYEIPNPKYEAIMEGMREKFHELSPDRIITGMALGIDQMAAHLATEMGIPYIATPAFPGMEKHWEESSRRMCQLPRGLTPRLVKSQLGNCPAGRHMGD